MEAIMLLRLFFAVCLTIGSVIVAHAIDVPIRPSEPNTLEFKKQLLYADSRNGASLTATIRNSDGKSLLLLTPTEEFTSAVVHLVFEDKTTQQLTLYADPTAPVSQKIAVPEAPEAEPDQKPAEPAPAAEPKPGTFYIPEEAKGARDLLEFLNRLQEATPVQIAYHRPLPSGLRGTVTRALQIGSKFAYEVEVANISARPIKLRAALFSHYLTDAVYITGMSPAAELTILAGDTAFVYILDVRSGLL